MSETEKTISTEPRRLIAYGTDNVGRFKHNFVRTVVCELRFPLLMELGTDQPPVAFVGALRKRYPQLERVSEISVSATGAGPAGNVHIFRSLRGGWTISLKQSSVSIEVKAYPGYEKFRERVLEVIEAAWPVIDSDFWTRVGLRYINEVPIEDAGVGRLGELVNTALVAGADSGIFHGINDFSGKIQGASEAQGYLLQHGLKREASGKGTIELSYVIDVDVWRAEVELQHTARLLDEMHQESFAIFDWSLGPESRQTLMGSE